MKKRGGVDAYKEELCAIIKIKKALVAEHKEEKAARWSELKSMEDEKWRSKLAAEERKVNAEERRLALEDERFAKEKKAEERAIIFMDPNTMDAKARRYWELTREEVINQMEVSRGGGDAFLGGCDYLLGDSTKGFEFV
ncbi:hypothetical protein ACQ4PT_042831 [Festuca glaucescens]